MNPSEVFLARACKKFAKILPKLNIVSLRENCARSWLIVNLLHRPMVEINAMFMWKLFSLVGLLSTKTINLNLVGPLKKLFTDRSFSLETLNFKLGRPEQSIDCLKLTDWGNCLSYKSMIFICGQSYKHFTTVNYDSRVIIWAIF